MRTAHFGLGWVWLSGVALAAGAAVVIAMSSNWTDVRESRTSHRDSNIADDSASPSDGVGEQKSDPLGSTPLSIVETLTDVSAKISDLSEDVSSAMSRLGYVEKAVDALSRSQAPTEVVSGAPVSESAGDFAVDAQDISRRRQSALDAVVVASTEGAGHAAAAVDALRSSADLGRAELRVADVQCGDALCRLDVLVTGDISPDDFVRDFTLDLAEREPDFNTGLEMYIEERPNGEKRLVLYVPRPGYPLPPRG